MGVTCPSCGFESAADAAYCDFCKEPFKKTKKEHAPPLPAPPAAAKILQELAKDLPKEALDKIPAHWMLNDEETVPQVRPWIRYAAWGFLFFWFAVAVVLTALMWLRWKPMPQP